MNAGVVVSENEFLVGGESSIMSKKMSALTVK